MSIEEKLDDSSWVSFVSPLVRIVERKQDSLSPPATSSEDQQPSLKSSVSPDVTGDASSAAFSSSSENHFEVLADLSTVALDMGNLPSAEAWEVNKTSLPADISGSLIDVGPHSWEQSR
jgi:hypothetical protein